MGFAGRVEFSEVFNLKPKYFNTYGVNINYFSSNLKRVIEIFDQFYCLNIYNTNNNAIGDTGSRRGAMTEFNEKASSAEKGATQLMVDKSLMDIAPNHSNLMGSTHLNTFFMRAETISNIGSAVNLRSASCIADEQTLEKSFMGDDLEIIQNFESMQGGFVQFKIPKTFIDNQNKKIMEKDRHQEITSKKAASVKRINVYDSQCTDEQKDRNLYTMLKIKVIFHRLLVKIRSKMRKSTHYCIKARIQLVYLRHKSLIIKALIVRQIESSGWEKNEAKNKLLVSRSRLNIRGHRSPYFDSQKGTNNEGLSKRKESDAFQLTEKENQNLLAINRSDESNDAMFKAIKIKNADQFDSGESEKSMNMSIDHKINKKEKKISPEKPKKKGKEKEISPFQKQRKLDYIKDDFFNNGSSEESKTSPKKEEEEISNFMSTLNPNQAQGPSVQDSDLFSFKNQQNIGEESLTGKEFLKVPLTLPPNDILSSSSNEKKEQGQQQKNFTFMNLSKNPESFQNQKLPWSNSSGGLNELQSNVDNPDVVSLSENKPFLGGSAEIFSGNMASVDFINSPSGNNPSQLFPEKEDIVNENLFGVRPLVSSDIRKTANFPGLVPGKLDSKEEIQREEAAARAAEKFNFEFGNGFESIKDSNETSRKELKNELFSDALLNNSLTIKAPENLSFIRRKSEFSDSRVGSSHFSPVSTRKNEDNKSRIPSPFSRMLSVARTTEDPKINITETFEQEIKHDINVEVVLNHFSEIQSESFVSEKAKADKLKNYLALVNSPFKPAAITHMICFNRLTFLATFIVELIVPAVSAYFAMMLGDKLNIYTTASSLVYLDLVCHVELKMVDFVKGNNLDSGIFNEMGVENITEWLVFDTLRENRVVLEDLLEELKEEMITSGEMNDFFFGIQGKTNNLYSSLYETVFMSWRPRNASIDFNGTEYLVTLAELRSRMTDFDQYFSTDRVLNYIWTPATYFFTIAILFSLYFFLRKASVVKMSVLNIFFIINQDEIKVILGKYSKFKRILEYIRGTNEESNEDSFCHDEGSDKMSVRNAMQINRSKMQRTKEKELESRKRKVKNNRNRIPKVQINYSKIILVLCIYFMIQVTFQKEKYSFGVPWSRFQDWFSK